MERDGRRLLPHRRRLVVVSAFMVAAGLALLFDVLRDIPPSHDCVEDEPAGHAAAALLLIAASLWAGRAAEGRRTSAPRAALWVLALLTGDCGAHARLTQR